MVLGWFREAKILDFRTFFDVFSKSFLKRVSEGEKIDQKCEKTKLFRFLGFGFRCTGRAWGEIIERGSSKFQKILWIGPLLKVLELKHIGLARRAHLRWAAD